MSEVSFNEGLALAIGGDADAIADLLVALERGRQVVARTTPAAEAAEAAHTKAKLRLGGAKRALAMFRGLPDDERAALARLGDPGAGLVAAVEAADAELDALNEIRVDARVLADNNLRALVPLEVAEALVLRAASDVVAAVRGRVTTELDSCPPRPTPAPTPKAEPKAEPKALTPAPVATGAAVIPEDPEVVAERRRRLGLNGGPAPKAHAIDPKREFGRLVSAKRKLVAEGRDVYIADRRADGVSTVAVLLDMRSKVILDGYGDALIVQGRRLDLRGLIAILGERAVLAQSRILDVTRADVEAVAPARIVAVAGEGDGRLNSLADKLSSVA